MTISKLQSEAVKELRKTFLNIRYDSNVGTAIDIEYFIADQIQKAVEKTRLQDMYIVSKHMSSLGWSKYFSEDKHFDAVSCRENILQEIKKLSIQSKGKMK